MKVSIQIPTYNQDKYIQRAIQSALEQDYEDLEVIVLDDNSTDKTYEIANRFSSERLKVYKNDLNIGRRGNYFKLLYELVSGDLVVNLDGDDYFNDKNFISKAVHKIMINDNIVFYQAAIVGKSPNHEFRFKHKLLNGEDEGTLNGKDYFRNFYKNEYFGHLSTVYRVDKARAVGFYSFNNLNTDAESLLKLALTGNVYLDNNVVGIWNIHNNNESKSAINKNCEIIESLERLKEYSSHFIGISEAIAWYNEAREKNFRDYMELLAELDFKRFLRESIRNHYFKKRFFILLTKKALGKI